MYCTVLYYTVQYSTALYCTVLYSTVQYSTVQYCTVLYSTVMYCTVLYCTVSKLWKLDVRDRDLILAPIIFELSWVVSMERDEMAWLEVSASPTFPQLRRSLSAQSSFLFHSIRMSDFVSCRTGSFNQLYIASPPPHCTECEAPCFLLFWCHFAIFADISWVIWIKPAFRMNFDFRDAFICHN
jgi:hypothetical protein